MPLLKSTDTEIVYGAPAKARLAAGLVGAFMLAVSTGIPVLLWTTRAQYIGQSPLALAGPIGFGCFSIMMGLFIFLFFQVNEEIVLDLQTRTYRYRAGITWLTRWHTGVFSDIEDVAARKVSTKQGTAYRVALQWKQTGRGFWRAVLRDMREFVLDQSDAKPLVDAESERNMLAEHLALPGTTNHAEAPEQVRQRSLRMTFFGYGGWSFPDRSAVRAADAAGRADRRAGAERSRDYHRQPTGEERVSYRICISGERTDLARRGHGGGGKQPEQERGRCHWCHVPAGLSQHLPDKRLERFT